jgi:positive regulator of sigma E activity
MVEHIVKLLNFWVLLIINLFNLLRLFMLPLLFLNFAYDLFNLLGRRDLFFVIALIGISLIAFLFANLTVFFTLD